MSITIGDAVVFMKVNDRGLKRGLAQSEKTVGGWLNNVGGKIVTGLTVAAAAGAAAIGGAIVAGVREFSGFEKGMNEVFTLLPDLSGAAMDEMRADVLGLAKDMGIIPSEVVPALYQAISAGVPRDNVFGFLETAQRAALGGVTDLTTSVDGISSVVNAYGEDVISATKASDLMFTAVRLGKTNFEQLSSNLAKVNPLASALGVNFGDVTAGLAAMTSQGTSTAEASTQLRGLLQELSKEGTVADETFRQAAGVGFAEFIAQGGNLAEGLALMEQRAKDTGVPIQDMFGQIEAGLGALQLTGKRLDTFRDNIAAMEDSAGATQEAYEQMDEGLARVWERIQANAKATLIRIGDFFAPLVEVLGGKLLEALDVAAGFLERFFGGINAGMSPLDALRSALMAFVPPEMIGDVSTAFRKIQQFIDLVVSFVSEHSEAIKGALIGIGAALAAVGIAAVIVSIATALGVLIGPIGAIIAIAGLLGAAWASNWGGIQEKTAAARDFLVNAFLFIKDRLSFFISQWKLIFQAFKQAFSGDWEGFGRTLRKVWDNAWKEIKKIGKNTFDAVEKFFTETDWDSLGKGILEGIAGGITGGLGLIRDAAVSAASAALEAAKGFLGITNPSRVFMEQVGGPMAEGAVVGFEEQLANLSGQIGDSLTSLPALMQPAEAGRAGGDTIQNFDISANYRYQSERSLRDTIRTLQMASGSG